MRSALQAELLRDPVVNQREARIGWRHVDELLETDVPGRRDSIIMRGFMQRSGSKFRLGPHRSCAAARSVGLIGRAHWQPTAVLAEEPPCPSATPAPVVGPGALPVRCTDHHPDGRPTAAAPPRRRTRAPTSSSPRDDATVGVDGDASLKGNVRREARRPRDRGRRRAVQARTTSAFKVEGGVEYTDPLVHVTGGGGSYSATQGADFRAAEFELRERSARGAARQHAAHARRRHQARRRELHHLPARTTRPGSCSADEITLDTRTRSARAAARASTSRACRSSICRGCRSRSARERKSGFLFPTSGTARAAACSSSVPYYWNIAPNADLTLRARVLRAARPRHRRRSSATHADDTLSKLSVNYPAERQHRGSTTASLPARDTSPKLPHDFRFFVDAETVSDSRYFEDFAQGPEGTSIAVPRAARAA